MKLKVFRYQEGKTRYDVFDIDEKKGMTVLEALFQIQDEQDGTLAFRYSCRGAVCGSCGMLINKVPRLACRTQLRDVKGELTVDLEAWGPLTKPVLRKRDEILVEPLPNLPVIRDLIVDMEPFFKLYREIEPWLVGEEPPENEWPMEPEKALKIETYSNCILCAVCHGACPVVKRDRYYLGPAVLAKAWRFYDDPRDVRDGGLLEKVDSQQGVWGCDTVYKCSEVCPKGVPPTQGITALRRRLLIRKLRGR
jgi:succinate dehydrogenase / fumarate reductase iron-sulfur subunit